MELEIRSRNIQKALAHAKKITNQCRSTPGYVYHSISVGHEECQNGGRTTCVTLQINDFEYSHKFPGFRLVAPYEISISEGRSRISANLDKPDEKLLRLGLDLERAEAELEKAQADLEKLEADLAKDDNTGGFPRIWELFPYILPKKVREEVYDLHHNNMLEDYLLTRKKYKTPLSRRWLDFCFTIRTAHSVIQCLYVMLGEKGRKALAWLMISMFGKDAIKISREMIFLIFRKF